MGPSSDEVPPRRVSVTLTGQSMIRGDTRTDAPSKIDDVRSLLAGDVVFTNFEAAVFDPTKGESIQSGRFASPGEALDALRYFGFNLLGLANNHSFDLGRSGIMNTVAAAERAGMQHAGSGADLAAAASPCYMLAGGSRIALIVVASGLVEEARATATAAGVNELRMSGAAPDPTDARRIIDSVREARRLADLVIVSHHNHHFPGVERPADFKQLLLSELPARLSPPAWLEVWARQLIDAGADLVAGHGPPFMHGIEIYKGKPIFYSLGNFIFQVPPESVHLEEPIMWESIVAEVEFEEDQVSAIRLHPIALNKIGRGLPNPHDEGDVNEYVRTRGLPSRARGPQARFLIERLTDFSEPFGTVIRGDGDQAFVDIGRAPPAKVDSSTF